MFVEAKKAADDEEEDSGVVRTEDDEVKKRTTKYGALLVPGQHAEVEGGCDRRIV